MKTRTLDLSMVAMSGPPRPPCHSIAKAGVCRALDSSSLLRQSPSGNAQFGPALTTVSAATLAASAHPGLEGTPFRHSTRLEPAGRRIARGMVCDISSR